jgi:hypothetical protein
VIEIFEFDSEENLPYDLWAHLVKIRADNTCEECGAKPTGPRALHADHVDTSECYDTAGWPVVNKLSNGRCLCASCHSKKTNRGRKNGPCTPERKHNISVALTGKTRTVEQRAAISAGTIAGMAKRVKREQE